MADSNRKLPRVHRGRPSTWSWPLRGNKLSLAPIVNRHLATLTDARTGNFHKADLVQFVAPIVVGSGAGVLYGVMGLAAPDPGGLLSGVAIFTGLMFGLATFVFQLRLEVRRSVELNQVASLRTQIDELFSNVVYAVLAGLVTTGVTVLGVFLHGYRIAGAVWLGFAAAMLVHFALVVAMCLKRLHRAYDRVNI